MGKHKNKHHHHHHHSQYSHPANSVEPSVIEPEEIEQHRKELRRMQKLLAQKDLELEETKQKLASTEQQIAQLSTKCEERDKKIEECELILADLRFKLSTRTRIYCVVCWLTSHLHNSIVQIKETWSRKKQKLKNSIAQKSQAATTPSATQIDAVAKTLPVSQELQSVEPRDSISSERDIQSLQAEMESLSLDGGDNTNSFISTMGTTSVHSAVSSKSLASSLWNYWSSPPLSACASPSFSASNAHDAVPEKPNAKICAVVKCYNNGNIKQHIFDSMVQSLNNAVNSYLDAERYDVRFEAMPAVSNNNTTLQQSKSIAFYFLLASTRIEHDVVSSLFDAVDKQNGCVLVVALRKGRAGYDDAIVHYKNGNKYDQVEQRYSQLEQLNFCPDVLSRMFLVSARWLSSNADSQA